MSDIIDWEEGERLRREDDEARARASRRDRGDGGGTVMVLAKTKTVGTYPTTAGKFFACEMLHVLGTETAGSSGTTTALGNTFFAYLPAGAPVPTSGSEVVCVRVPHRWVISV